MGASEMNDAIFAVARARDFLADSPGSTFGLIRLEDAMSKAELAGFTRDVVHAVAGLDFLDDSAPVPFEVVA
jgi:stage V sporulation protein SpoVS